MKELFLFEEVESLELNSTQDFVAGTVAGLTIVGTGLGIVALIAT